MTLIKRADKGQALTYEELDGNFTHLGGDGSYQFPATDGTANQVLQTDGNGNLTFQSAGLPELITADFKGSVFADDSTLIVDGLSGNIFTPSIEVTGLATLAETTEILSSISGATGTVIHNLNDGAIFYHTSAAANFTANFTNVPITNNRAISIAITIVQGATAYITNAVQVDGVAQTINWNANATPTGTSNNLDVISFTLIRTGSAWTVIGSLSTFGT